MLSFHSVCIALVRMTQNVGSNLLTDSGNMCEQDASTKRTTVACRILLRLCSGFECQTSHGFGWDCPWDRGLCKSDCFMQHSVKSMSNMHCHKLFLPCLLCRCMQIFAGLLSTRPGNMSLQEATLDRITKSNTHMVMVVWRPVYHEMKQLHGKEKGTWWKAIVRLVDQKGQGLYAEIRGSSESSVRKRAPEFYQPKFIQLTQAVVVQNSPFLSGFSADVTNKVRWSYAAFSPPPGPALVF